MALELRRSDALEAPRGRERALTADDAREWACGVRALTAEDSSRWRTHRWPIILIIINFSISIPERRASSASSSSSSMHQSRAASVAFLSVRPRSSSTLLRDWSRSASLLNARASSRSPPAGCGPTPGCSRCSSSTGTWCSHTYHLRTVSMTERGRAGSVCVCVCVCECNLL